MRCILFEVNFEDKIKLINLVVNKKYPIMQLNDATNTIFLEKIIIKPLMEIFINN
jgi:hypothetical protein